MTDQVPDYSTQKLTLRWALPDEQWPTEADENAAEQLARAIDPLLAAAGSAEVNGFELGSGEIDILVFGADTDDDVDTVYELVAPAFRAYGCPPGSRIIRHYRNRGEDVESDVQP